MSIAVHVSSALREFSGCPSEIQLVASSITDALSLLKQYHPSLYRSVCDETGGVRRHVNLFVNADAVPVCPRSGLQRALRPGDVLTIWQAVSGG